MFGTLTDLAIDDGCRKPDDDYKIPNLMPMLVNANGDREADVPVETTSLHC